MEPNEEVAADAEIEADVDVTAWSPWPVNIAVVAPAESACSRVNLAGPVAVSSGAPTAFICCGCGHSCQMMSECSTAQAMPRTDSI